MQIGDLSFRYKYRIPFSLTKTAKPLEAFSQAWDPWAGAWKAD